MNLKNKIITGAIALASILNFNSCNNYKPSKKDNLREENFKNCNWALCENYDNIRKIYMGEKIPRNINNYDYYLYYVFYINQGNDVGKVFFPDLDKDSKIISRFLNENSDTIFIEKTPLKWISGKELFKRIENEN